jgi:hypothetical protein
MLPIRQANEMVVKAATPGIVANSVASSLLPQRRAISLSRSSIRF